MLKATFDGIMERRSSQLIEQVGAWLPGCGRVLDVGSGTGHLAVRLEREHAVQVMTADVTDMHVMGRAPMIIQGGILPFADASFDAALLFFMLHYPPDPVATLAEAARVTRGPIIVVQSLYHGRAGYGWLRIREFVWTTVAFYVSKAVGYVPREAAFTMSAQRFYSGAMLAHDVHAAGLEVEARSERSVLPGGALIVAAWVLRPRR